MHPQTQRSDYDDWKTTAPDEFDFDAYVADCLENLARDEIKERSKTFLDWLADTLHGNDYDTDRNDAFAIVCSSLVAEECGIDGQDAQDDIRHAATERLHKAYVEWRMAELRTDRDVMAEIETQAQEEAYV